MVTWFAASSRIHRRDVLLVLSVCMHVIFFIQCCCDCCRVIAVFAWFSVCWCWTKVQAVDSLVLSCLQSSFCVCVALRCASEVCIGCRLALCYCFILNIVLPVREWHHKINCPYTHTIRIVSSTPLSPQIIPFPSHQFTSSLYHIGKMVLCKSPYSWVWADSCQDYSHNGMGIIHRLAIV